MNTNKDLKGGLTGNMAGINQRAPNIPMPAPDGFSEAPMLETLADPTEELREQKTKNGVTSMNFDFNINTDRIDGRRKMSFQQVKGISNKALNDLFEQGKLNDENVSIAPKILVDVEYIQYSGSYVIWEEGGAEQNHGSVLVVATATGDKKDPLQVFHNDKIKNGRHASVILEKGDLVILGVNINDSRIMVAYEVTGFENATSAICEGKAVFMDEERTLFDDVAEFELNSDSPVIKAAYKRMTEDKLVTTPCWVNDWTIHKFDKDDFKAALSNPDSPFRKSMKSFTSLKDAYDAVTTIIREKVKTLPRSKHALVNTALDINCKDENGNEAIFVFITGVIYDVATKSSLENLLFYGRVIVRPGDEFFYIDNPDSKFSYDQVAAYLKQKKDGDKYVYRGTSCWRMTE